MHLIIIEIIQVMDGHCQTRVGILSDYCDAKHCLQHQLFSTDPVELQLILYYDELELCNPLGSRCKEHKVGMSCTCVLFCIIIYIALYNVAISVLYTHLLDIIMLFNFSSCNSACVVQT